MQFKKHITVRCMTNSILMWVRKLNNSSVFSTEQFFCWMIETVCDSFNKLHIFAEKSPTPYLSKGQNTNPYIALRWTNAIHTHVCQRLFYITHNACHWRPPLAFLSISSNSRKLSNLISKNEISTALVYEWLARKHKF